MENIQIVSLTAFGMNFLRGKVIHEVYVWMLNGKYHQTV